MNDLALFLMGLFLGTGMVFIILVLPLQRRLRKLGYRLPPGFRILRDTTHAERSWPEDVGENSWYSNVCCNCGRDFLGYKRRVTCRVCNTPGANDPGEVA